MQISSVYCNTLNGIHMFESDQLSACQPEQRYSNTPNGIHLFESDHLPTCQSADRYSVP